MLERDTRALDLAVSGGIVARVTRHRRTLWKGTNLNDHEPSECAPGLGAPSDECAPR